MKDVDEVILEKTLTNQVICFTKFINSSLTFHRILQLLEEYLNCVATGPSWTQTGA